MIENASIAIDNFCGVDAQLFDTTPALKYTTLYAIQIVGEAAAKLSEELKRAHPDIAWDEIVATRHVVAHGYDRINPATIIEIAQNDMPVLMDALRGILRLEP